MLRLSVSKHVAANHAAAPWLVVVPRRLSATGKRQFHYFTTKVQAEAYAASVRRLVRQQGERPFALAADVSADARAATSVLDGSGLSLVQAALLARQFLGLKPEGVAREIPEEKALVPGATVPAHAEPEKPPRLPFSPLARRSRRLPTLASLFKEMQAGKTHQSPHTQRSRMGRFHTFFRRNAELATRPLHLVSAREVELALNRSWPKAPTSWNTMLTHLRTLFNYAVRKGMLAASPLRAIDRKFVQEREIMPLPPQTLRALLLACRPPNAAELARRREEPCPLHRELALDTSGLVAYVAIAAFAGIRPTEITRLKWGDINLEEDCISVRRTASKTGGTRHVELHPTLRAWLEPLNPGEHSPGEFLFRPGTQLTRRLHVVRHRAGFHAGNPWPEDALRHSYASYYLKAGGALERLQLNMGHASSALIYSRYCNMCGLTRQMAAEWWGMRPETLSGQTER